MEAEVLVYQLEQLGIRLNLRAGELHIQAPRGVLTPELQNKIRKFKPDLICLLTPSSPGTDQPKSCPIDFSLFFFGNQNQLSPQDNYSLLFEAASFADQHHFTGIWTPERHFNPLGGPFPNPALFGAALAMRTQHLKLRAGSVVLPLQDPLRVAEDWAVVDQLSQGRVELSFASGWHANDFVLAPQAYTQRQDKMYQGLEEVKKLWAGQSIQRMDGSGQMLEVQTYPPPLQNTLPIWLTAIGNPQSYQKIGSIGAHLLTCLLDQEVDELAAKIKLYRQALARHGFDPRAFKVAVFLHTYVGLDLAKVKAEVQEPFQTYLKSSLDLLGKLSQSFKIDLDPRRLDTPDQDALLAFAFERYFQHRALMGDKNQVEKMIQALHQADVQEIACLIDFGMPPAAVMQSLEILGHLVQTHRSVTHA